MPRAVKPPLNGLFALNKPSGATAMSLLNELQILFASSKLFRDPNSGDYAATSSFKGKYRGKKKWQKGKQKGDRIKIGQGGTLDPLADGVLVVAVGSATKHLSQFLECTKDYTSIGLVGCATDSYDAKGKRVKETPFGHVTRQTVEQALVGLRGDILQIPPIYSALRMDGKHLYDYARAGEPLPRPIPARPVTVSELELLDFRLGSEHDYVNPEASLSEIERKLMQDSEKLVADNLEAGVKVPATVVNAADQSDIASGTSDAKQPIFEIKMSVSSGTYVRTIVHDIGVAMGTSAHVVKLTRTRQGRFYLAGTQPKLSVASGTSKGKETSQSENDELLPSEETIEWNVFASALDDLKERKDDAEPSEAYAEWEQILLRHMHIV
ncbi:uncharacterized protein L969DRAFT_91608 [Mixia osmundae IAM 14324]|uniref:tRNA pseudouridine(55) synthase n=1 Tax=Mixia osmundae (strain CBS 9802 / IAM 14324 / JCM 22182 / KY 12970) TaxID=764103 RepID=G7DZZ2_MIXOS|nr:uncharacterized protein L969DRAFT_91608 [Mixia osmundae IAM 14324]KEI42144.1 hypothetical protein L969DRAFT_91608 [Mixia osmundae IAM 14324]GAA96152.1 hypothetical protein E5Q_02813 [Mixia osmundae IAM 14324]